jgi:hypothetical protein
MMGELNTGLECSNGVKSGTSFNTTAAEVLFPMFFFFFFLKILDALELVQ